MTNLDDLGPIEFHFGDGLPDAIERVLHDAICDGTLAPGVRLREQELAAHFEVSSTPVREAVRRLSHSGLVELLPRRGAAVSGISWDEVASLLELREVIESAAVRKAAGRENDPRRMEELQQIIVRMEEQLDDPTDRAFVQLDSEFHLKLVALAGNRALEQADQIAQRQLVRARVIFKHSPSPARVKESHQQHVEILEAIRSQDPDGAEGALRAHVRSVHESLIALFEDQDRGSTRS